MTSLAAPALDPPAPGRPIEIEEWTNRRLVHPLSRALVDLLLPTGISPNAVSVLGVVMAAGAGAAFLLLPWPAAALTGFAFHVAWHVFDGADGQLARRTGRASPNGELVDGICDHAGQLAIYLAFALLLSRSLGAWAFLLAAGAGVSRAAQASAYETCRRDYRRWVYGAGWIRQTLSTVEASASPWKRAAAHLGRLYLAVSAMVSADDRAVEAAMAALTAEPGARAGEARALYRAHRLPVVKRASLLSANWRTVAAFLSMLAGSPVYYLLWELVGLNLAMALLARTERTANARLLWALEPLRGPPIETPAGAGSSA
jgi:phosphatidylglycerophosphate synthase